jgi:hypothetical protein
LEEPTGIQSEVAPSIVSESCVEYVSDVSSIFMAPSTVAASESESVVNRNLHFLAREIELEK